MNRYQGFGPRPEMVPLRDGVVDLSSMTPEKGEYLAALTRDYPLPPVEDNARTAFIGITTDGNPIPGLFTLQDEGLDCKPIVAAANDLLAVLDIAERQAIRQEVNADAWRMWTNAFPVWAPHGLRLQDLSDAKRDAVTSVIRATLSSQGYTQTRDVMKLNGELGDFLGQYPDTLTEWMYWFSMFGTPHPSEPWGWQLYGHHLDLNCLIVGRQLVMTPSFMGAEFHSEQLFGAERTFALELVNALSENQLSDAVVYERFSDLPHELEGPVDGRHRGGAGQDNRIVPYEGIAGSGFSCQQRSLFDRLLEAWTGRVPEAPAAARRREIEAHIDATHFAWYGPHSGEGAFYYRIQSPVVMIEYDNHPGVFLDNNDPQPFHVHTIVRTPNGNDYGKDLLRQHLERHDHGGSAAMETRSGS